MNEDILDVLDVINKRLITIETKLEEKIDNSDEKEMVDLLGERCGDLVAECKELTSGTREFQGNMKKYIQASNEVNASIEKLLEWTRKKIDSHLVQACANGEDARKEFFKLFTNKWIGFKNKFVTDFLWLVGFTCTILCISSFCFGSIITRRINGWYLDTVFEQFYEDKFYSELERPMEKAEKEASEYLKEKKAEADEYLKNQMILAREKADEEYRVRMEAYARNAIKQVNKETKKGGKKDAVKSVETE